MPGLLNPADDASRGLDLSRISNERWFKGPAFLYEEVSI